MFVACAVLLVSRPALAVLVFVKDAEQPIAALLVAQDADQVTIRVPLAGGKFQERVLRRSEIEDMIVSVSPERLARLRPDAPQGYRNYAEELAEKRKDPDARQTAIRLYLIAAHLAPAELGRSSLVGMADLAETPRDAQKFRAMAFLLDPAHDRRLLTPVHPGEGLAAATPGQSRPAMVESLRLLRQGRYAEALRQATPIKALFDHPGARITFDEFTAACRRPPADGLPDDLLRRVLELELALTGAAATLGTREPAENTDPKSWARILSLGDNKPVPSLSLQSITEFDPRKCVFRDGRWVEP